MSFVFYSPEPYPGELRDRTSFLDGERQQIGVGLGTDHPLYTLVDGALRSSDVDELRVAHAAVHDWPYAGKNNMVAQPE